MDLEVVAETPARDVARGIAEQLAAAGVPSPDADARWLVEGICGVDPHRTPERPLPADRVGALRDATVRRAVREPLQLIVGSTSFRGIELTCRPGIFVPRPETEVVAGLAIAAARARGPGPVQVVDACTGSGAIACCLVVEVPEVRVVATDRDPAAVDLARDNLVRVRDGHAGVAGFAPGSDAEVVRCELLDGVDSGLRGHLDVLVANPPYLPASDADHLAAEVALHDPHAALFGGAQGHEIVDRLLELAAQWLRPAGVVVLEIDARLGQAALAAAARAGLATGELVRDLTGRHRALVARRADTDEALPCPPRAGTADRRAEAGS